MKSSTIKYIALFNLLLGGSLLSAGWLSDISAYRFLEDSYYKLLVFSQSKLSIGEAVSATSERVLYVPPEETDGALLGEDVSTLKPQNVYWEMTPYVAAPLPEMVVVEIGDDPENVFLEYPLLPMDYAVIFYQLGQLGANNVVATSPLSWPPPVDQMEMEALGYEIAAYNKSVLGLVLSPSARRANLPKYLEPMVLHPQQIQGGIGQLISAGRVVDAPQIPIESNVYAAPLRVETESETMETEQGRKVPLFIRWGNYVLPTLPLLGVLDSLNLTVNDIRVHFGKMLYLGGKRRIPIDEMGHVFLRKDAAHGVLRVSATRLMPDIDPEAYKQLGARVTEADAVILGEGKTPLGKLGTKANILAWDWNQSLDVTAAAMQSVLMSDMPGEIIKLARLSRGGQVLFLLISLLLMTWAVASSSRKRIILFGGAVLLSIVTSFALCAGFHIWLPLTPVFVAFVLASLSTLFLDAQLESPLQEPKKSSSPYSVEEEVDKDDERELAPVPPPTPRG